MGAEALDYDPKVVAQKSRVRLTREDHLLASLQTDLAIICERWIPACGERVCSCEHTCAYARVGERGMGAREHTP